MTLKGARTVLRPVAEDDAELVVRWRSTPGIADWMFGAPPTEAGHRAWVKALRERRDRLEYVILRAEDGKPVGTTGLAEIGEGRAEFGILMGEPGPGLALDAGRTLLAHAFGPLGLDRLYLRTFADNARAYRFFVRLGFQEEGILREHALKDGRRRDVRVMGLLRPRT